MDQEAEFNIQKGKNLWGGDFAQVSVGPDYWVSISPHSQVPNGTGWNVRICRDKNGKPDFGNICNATVVDGTEDDLEEIALTYAKRLKNGTKPEEIFGDSEEYARSKMKETSQKFHK